MIRKISITFLVIFSVVSARAQSQLDVGSQYMYHRSLLNPAAMFQHAELSAAVITRQQWVGFKGAPKTNLFRISQANLHSAVGFGAHQELVGNFNYTKLVGSYASRIRLTNTDYLSFGVSGGLFFRGQKTTMTTNPGDLAFASTGMLIKPDMELGLYLTGNRYYIGASIPSVVGNQIYYEESSNKMSAKVSSEYFHYNIDGGYAFELSDDWGLNTFAMLKFVVNSPIVTDVNAVFEYKNILGLGMSYRFTNRIGLVANFKVSKSLRLGYGYENTQGINNVGGLHTHEIGLFYQPNIKRLLNRRNRF